MQYYLSAIDSIGIAKTWPPLLLHSLTDLHVSAEQWIDEMIDYSVNHEAGRRQCAAEWYVSPPTEAVATMLWVSNHWVPGCSVGVPTRNSHVFPLLIPQDGDTFFGSKR